MLEIWLPLLGGLTLLIVGGDLLVRGSVQAATRLGVSPLVIGLTLVGFGSSTPELVTSVEAAILGSPGIAFGNIVGSNIANILLVAGLSALIFPIAISSSSLKRDGVIMVGVAMAFALVSWLFPFGSLIGIAAVLLLAFYIYWAFRQEKSSPSGEHGAVYEKGAALELADPDIVPGAANSPRLSLSLMLAGGGLIAILVGGYFLVSGAVHMARSLAVSETVIGLTIVAIGTSAPELVTSVIAALKRQGDIAFGNIVGSNIYNILGIGGMTALIAPSRVPAEIVSFDNFVMVGVSTAFVILAYTGLRITRWEGGVLLSGYVLYVYSIWPSASGG
jgi:cation:H+ antiporter